MKHFLIIGFLCFLVSACSSSSGRDQNVESGLPDSDAKAHVYYFHGKTRCVTCIALQEIAEEAFLEHYKENKDVAFHEVDFSDKANKALAEKYEIVFSSLVIANDTDHKNLTNTAFSLVMSNPDSLKLLIINEINAVLHSAK
jgi:hypothetical protein